MRPATPLLLQTTAILISQVQEETKAETGTQFWGQKTSLKSVKTLRECIINYKMKASNQKLNLRCEHGM